MVWDVIWNAIRIYQNIYLILFNQKWIKYFYAIIWRNLPNFILSERRHNKRPHTVWFSFNGTLRVGKSTEIDRLCQVAESKEELELEGYYKARGWDTRTISIFFLGLCASRGRSQWRHQLPISLRTYTSTFWSTHFRDLSTIWSSLSVTEIPAVLPPSLPNISCGLLTCCFHQTEHTGEASSLRGSHLSCGVLPSVFWAVAVDATLRIPGTTPTRLLFQSSTFWYHHFFCVVPTVWKMLTAFYIVDLLMSAFSLFSFRLSTPTC